MEEEKGGGGERVRGGKSFFVKRPAIRDRGQS